MKLLILYYSGTGNTEFACTVARLAAEKEGHRVTMSTYGNAEGLLPGDFDACCFATPVQAWHPMRNVERFLKAMPRLPGQAAFLISTSGGMPSQVASQMTRWLREKGMVVYGHFDLKCPDSFPVTRRITRRQDPRWPSPGSVRALAGFTVEMLDWISDGSRGEAGELPGLHLIPTPLYLFSRLERMSSRFPDMVMGKKKADHSACTRCGKCASGCPAGAIELDPFPVYSRECDACWKCVNLCPEDCISTPIAGRYHYKGIGNREGLLKEAGLLD